MEVGNKSDCVGTPLPSTINSCTLQELNFYLNSLLHQYIGSNVPTMAVHASFMIHSGFGHTNQGPILSTRGREPRNLMSVNHCWT